MTKLEQAARVALNVLENKCDPKDEVVIALREALEEQAGDPKPMHPEIKKLYEDFFDKHFAETQRRWTGLTDEEIDAIFAQHHDRYGECESPNFGYERAIETKLKEKNT